MVLGPSEKFSIKYHDIFDYPLISQELRTWKSSISIASITSITNKDGFYFLKGREKIINKRLRNEKHSQKKMVIAKSASRILSSVPSILFIGITGALAMNNAGKDGDIDLIIITKKNTLWLTRLVVLVLLFLLRIPVRRANQRDERDKLCLNMWLDENDLVWDKKDRNIYTAHEIAQIKPLVNKQKIFEKFLFKNRWILDYWPMAVIIKNLKKITNQEIVKIKNSPRVCRMFNYITFKLQYLYMRTKITREVVTPTRAIFHPNDWGKKVIKRLSI